MAALLEGKSNLLRMRQEIPLNESELAALEALLELPDNELGDWLTRRLPIPPEADTPMMRRIRSEAGNPASSSQCGRRLGGGGRLSR